MITSLCIFVYDKNNHRFRLDGLLPGATLEEVRDNTGFDFDCHETISSIAGPEPERVDLIRSRIAGEIAETYPEFAQSRLGWKG